jgi:hypothetical protein
LKIGFSKGVLFEIKSELSLLPRVELCVRSV